MEPKWPYLLTVSLNKNCVLKQFQQNKRMRSTAALLYVIAWNIRVFGESVYCSEVYLLAFLSSNWPDHCLWLKSIVTLHSCELSVAVRVSDTDVNLLPENGLGGNVGMSLEQRQENSDPIYCIRYGEMRADCCACVTSVCPIQMPVVQLEPTHL